MKRLHVWNRKDGGWYLCRRCGVPFAGWLLTEDKGAWCKSRLRIKQLPRWGR